MGWWGWIYHCQAWSWTKESQSEFESRQPPEISERARGGNEEEGEYIDGDHTGGEYYEDKTI